MSADTNELVAWFISAVLLLWLVRVMYDPKNKD